ELLRAVQIAGRDDEEVVGPDTGASAERRGERPRRGERTVALDGRMRHDEDRRRAPEVAQVPPRELRMDDHTSRVSDDVRTPGLRKRLAGWRVPWRETQVRA